VDWVTGGLSMVSIPGFGRILFNQEISDGFSGELMVGLANRVTYGFICIHYVLGSVEKRALLLDHFSQYPQNL
jgi:hypothetical protein